MTKSNLPPKKDVRQQIAKPVKPVEQPRQWTEEDCKKYSPVILMVAEKEGFSPAFVPQNREHPLPGPPETKTQLFKIILDKLVWYKELYRDAYSRFSANKVTFKWFGETDAMPMLLATKGTIELSEKLMKQFDGGVVWKYVNIDTHQMAMMHSEAVDGDLKRFNQCFRKRRDVLKYSFLIILD
jgi:hypothetical protein